MFFNDRAAQVETVKPSFLCTYYVQSTRLFSISRVRYTELWYWNYYWNYTSSSSSLSLSSPSWDQLTKQWQLDVSITLPLSGSGAITYIRFDRRGIVMIRPADYRIHKSYRALPTTARADRTVRLQTPQYGT